MNDSNDISRILEEAAGGLNRITDAYQSSTDITFIQLELDRWRERTIADIAEHISPREAARLAKLPGRPSFIERDDLGAIIQEQRSFLVSLMRDVERNPSHYGPQIVKQQKTPSRGVQPASLPEKITVEWLREHVPIEFWISAGAIIIAAFYLGLRLAMSAGVRKILSELPFLFPSG